MGMFDKMFLNTPEQPKTTLAEGAMFMVPFLGPMGAFYSKDRRRKKALQDALDEQEQVSDYVDDNPLSQRVAQRMMNRTNQTSMPGVLGAHMLRQEMEKQTGPGGANNIGNAYTTAANRLGAQGYTEEATKLGAFANKNLQTPWKPEEGSSAIRDPATNLMRGRTDGKYLPNQKVYKAETRVVDDKQIEGYMANTTDENGEVSFGDWVPGTTTEGDRYSSKTNFTVGGSTIDVGSMFTDNERARKEEEFSGRISAFEEAQDDLSALQEIARPGTVGLGGAVMRFADRIYGGIQAIPVGGNVFAFAANETNEKGETSAEVLQRYSSDQRFGAFVQALAKDGVDAQRAYSIAIRMAYTIARANNMGTAGGGRGITDADMKYALDQLGFSGSPEAFRAVLGDLNKRISREYHRSMPGHLNRLGNEIAPADMERYKTTIRRSILNSEKTVLKAGKVYVQIGDDQWQPLEEYMQRYYQ